MAHEFGGPQPAEVAAFDTVAARDANKCLMERIARLRAHWKSANNESELYPVEHELASQVSELGAQLQRMSLKDPVLSGARTELIERSRRAEQMIRLLLDRQAVGAGNDGRLSVPSIENINIPLPEVAMPDMPEMPKLW